MAYEVKARLLGYEDYEEVDLSVAEYVFERGLTDALYLEEPGTIELIMAGRKAVWVLPAGITRVRTTGVITAGTSVGGVRGLYCRKRR